MPLLRRLPFIREQPPANIKPIDEVFYCKVTKEVFTDYEKFFERTILCNSLVWTCAYTGHPGLTFQEALDSEQKAKDQLAAFPSHLKRPLLCLATLTHRRLLNDMNDDIYLFAKDHFFIGEIIDAVVGNEKKTGTVMKVNVSQSSSKKSTEGSDKRKSFGTDPSNLLYVVQVDDDKSTHILDSCKVGCIEFQRITHYLHNNLERHLAQSVAGLLRTLAGCITSTRQRRVLTRDRCKLFLKKHCCADSYGIWRVKPKYYRQFQLQEVTFDTVCGGEAPVFATSQPKKTKSASKHVSDCEDDNFNGGLSSDEDTHANEVAARQKQKKKQKLNEATPELEPKAKKLKLDKENLKNVEDELQTMKNIAAERAIMKEKIKEEKLAAKLAKKDEMKKKADEEKEKRKMEKKKMQEEKKQHEEIMREWNKIREDMECEDLKALPVPKPVKCCVPAEGFGSALFVLEFIVNFKSLLDFDLSTDLSFDNFAQSLVSNELDGTYFEILKEFMSAIFRHQEDEELNEDEEDDDKMKEAPEVPIKESTSKSSREVVRLATICAQWPVLNFATPLRKVQLDSYTISEVVRLHLLGSGCERTAVSARFDYQQRGGYAAMDDPALDFRRSEPEVLKQLAERTIFDLSSVDKVKILSVLVNQLLTFAVCRDHIEECAEKVKQVQRDLRAHQVKEARRERDEVQYWWKKKTDERLKGQEQTIAPNGNGEHLQNEGAPSVYTKEKTNTPKDNVRKRQRQKKQELCEKDFESMPAENIDWEKISPEERQQMKDWAKRKEAELSEEICELEFCCNMTAIGRDRTFRRYWVFRSTPGLFVEDDEQYIPYDFLTPVLQKTSTVTDNEFNRSSPLCNASDSMNDSTVKMEVDCSTHVGEDSKDISCFKSAMSVTEQIATRNSVRWSVFISKNDIDQLVESLNTRGTRESKLRQVISEQRDLLSELVAKCETSIFCAMDEKTLNIGPANVAEKLLEENLRDSLLDIEERIFSGNMGSMKVDSRFAWRSALSNFSYSPQCNTLTYGSGQTLAVQPTTVNGVTEVSGSVEASVYVKTEVSDSDVKTEVSDSDLKTEVSNSTVRDLAMALLQIEQMLEAKYINPPLGEDEGTKKQKQKALIEAAFKSTQKVKNDDAVVENGDINGHKSDDEESNPDSCAENSGRIGRQRSPIERWEESLLSSTSLSQLYVHLSVLDMSVAWSRSSLHARCRICRRKGDGEHMLLCDACDRGHHMYCLKPPVKHVPEGDWFCPSCRPKEVVHVPRTPRKSFEVDSSEESDADESDVEKDADDSSDTENETGFEECDTLTDTEIYGNTTEDDVSTISRSTKASARKSGNHCDYQTPPSRTWDKSVDGNDENGSLGRGQRSKTPSARAFHVDSTGITEKSRSRRSVEMPNGRIKEKKTSRQSFDCVPKRKTSAEWDNYEVDTKRLSLSTKSRSGEAEHGLKIAQDLVTELMQHDDAWPFLRPVTKKEALDYFDIIKQPMDFSTIRNKLNRFVYNEISEILDDVRLIFSNCMLYNLPNSIVAMAGSQLQQHFESRLRQLKLTVDKRNSLSGVDQTVAKTQRAANRKRTL